MYIPRSADPLQAITNRELAHVTESLLAKNILDQRLIFSLRLLNVCNDAKTTEVLNISESNVKVRLRAKSMIRKEIEKRYNPKEIYDFNLVNCDLMVNCVFTQIMQLINNHKK